MPKVSVYTAWSTTTNVEHNNTRNNSAVYDLHMLNFAHLTIMYDSWIYSMGCRESFEGCKYYQLNWIHNNGMHTSHINLVYQVCAVRNSMHYSVVGCRLSLIPSLVRSTTLGTISTLCPFTSERTNRLTIVPTTTFSSFIAKY